MKIPSERRLAVAGIMALVVLAIVLRLASIVFVPSLNWRRRSRHIAWSTARGLYLGSFSSVPGPGYYPALSRG